MQRRLQAVDSLQQVTLPRMAVSCHNCNVQLYRGKHDYVNSVIGTSNPLGKDGKRPAFIESPRCHLDVSLLLEVTSVNSDNQDTFLTAVASTFERMKVAGGDILSRCMVYKEKQPRPRDKTMLKLFYINDFAEDDVLKHQHSIMHMLMPGFVDTQVNGGGGGMDANNWNAAGIATVGVATGYSGNHGVSEQIYLDDLLKAGELAENIVMTWAEMGLPE